MTVKTSTVFGEPPISGYQRCYNLLRDEFTTGWSTGGGDPVRTAEWEKCKTDTAYWIDKYCHTYDPRTPGKGLPFKLWPKQVLFIEWLGRLKAEAARLNPIQVQGLCEKSRDVGVSFLCAADTLHDFLFVPGFKAGFGSRKLEYVDELGNLDSILEKIRFMLRKLPAWMLPQGWKFGKHDMFCRIINPANGALISGEGGDGIGRGGRTSIYYVDEAAFVERPHLVDAALIATTGLRIDVSTPNGAGNPFAVKRRSLPPDKVFTLHWRDDPRKGNEWAEETKRTKGVTVFASEYDIDYSASIEGITIPGAWVRAAVDFLLPPRVVNGQAAPWTTYKCSAGLDVAEEGDDLSVFIARNGPAVRMPVSWSKCNTTETAWRARDEGAKAGVKALHYDPIGVGCLEGSTLIGGVPVAERTVPGVVRTLVGDFPATRGFAKGVADLYRVRTQSGRSVTVTTAHRFLTPSGWQPLSRLVVGSFLAADDNESEHSSWETARGLPGRCSTHSRPYGGLQTRRGDPQSGRASRLAALVDAALGLLSLQVGLPSTDDFWSLWVGLGDEAKRLVVEVVDELAPQTRRELPPSSPLTRQIHRVVSTSPRPEVSLDCSDLCQLQDRTDGESKTQYSFPSSTADKPLVDSLHRTRDGQRTPSSVCGTSSFRRPNPSGGQLQEPVQECSLRYYRESWDEIKEVSWVRTGEFYDLHVPLFQHYSAAGLWHHNSGVKGTLLTAEREDAIEADLRPSEVKAVKVPFTLHPVNVGEAPTDLVWPDGQTSKEKFKNLKAELWWRLRTRFERTYEFVTKGIQHAAEDMISIPDHPTLIAELSAPLHFRGENGKLQIEAKKDLKRRGIKSPDFAEALVISEAEFGKKKQQFFVR